MVIDGKMYAEKFMQEFGVRYSEYRDYFKRKIGIAVVQVEPDASSVSYLKRLMTTAAKADVDIYTCDLSFVNDTEQLMCEIEKLNLDSKIDGIIVHLPLPPRIEKRAVETICVTKDIDGLTTLNAGNLFLGNETAFYPGTPMGVMKLLEMCNVEIGGKRAVVLGRSNIVGKPMAQLLMKANATVTVCHSKTRNIAEVVRENDIVVSAIGKAEFVTADMIKEGAIVMDVGVNFSNGKICGDVDFKNVADKCSVITPVPNGCGPMTVCMLLDNALKGAIARTKALL
ncbi:MAG: bifunctional 5,10-methylenetetrahydrofolate dehydrogenase/5,10-methenyltetrahydrofolate cyclohydrolase [Clostridia bacterium]|nr:bifunctional 5,10-methylenetetrahydrofolate dehydrogenase/5,10-methenyltetrahydrofolate cyclohydrolase [Clostridia bacterium]